MAVARNLRRFSQTPVTTSTIQRDSFFADRVVTAASGAPARVSSGYMIGEAPYPRPLDSDDDHIQRDANALERGKSFA